MDARAAAKHGQHAHKIRAPERYAPFRRRETGASHVHKNGAAASAHARLAVAVEHDNQVVEAVLPPHLFGGGCVGVANTAIVVAILGFIAPAVGGLKDLQGQARPRARASVRTVKYAFKGIGAGWSCAITFPFDGMPSAPAQGTRQGEAPSQEHAAGRCPRQRPHKQLTSSLLSHHFPGRDNLPLLAPPGPSEPTANSDTAPDGGI